MICSARRTDTVRAGGALGFSYRTPGWYSPVFRSGGRARSWESFSSTCRRRAFRADRGRESPSSTRAVAFSQWNGVPPVRPSWPSTFSRVRGTFTARSGTGPSTWTTRPWESSAATWAGSPA